MKYNEMVKRLAKDGKLILGQMEPYQAYIWHMATGVSGEAGELLDAVKKHVVYQKPLDRVNIIEELGDLEFYMEGLRQQLGISRKQTLEQNKRKLAVRYAGYEYSNEAAQNRADKEDE